MARSSVPRLPNDPKRIVAVSAAVGAFVGIIVAWCARQLLHLHDPGLSNHARH